MFSATLYPASRLSFKFVMMCHPGKWPLVDMNHRSGLTWIFSSVRFSHDGSCGYPLSSILCASTLVGSGHWSRICFALFVGLHKQEVAGLMGVGSAVVSSHRILARADTVRRGSLAVGAKGCLVGFSVKWNVCCYSIMSRWWGCERSHDRVVLLHVHVVLCLPMQAIESARSFPRMVPCDAVHFPLTLLLLCCKTFASSGHFLTFSLPAAGPPHSVLSAFGCRHRAR